jgi:hypothetical protein
VSAAAAPRQEVVSRRPPRADEAETIQRFEEEEESVQEDEGEMTFATDQYETAAEGGSSDPAEQGQTGGKQQWRVRFEEGRMYPSLSDFKEELPSTSTARADYDQESDT